MVWHKCPNVNTAKKEDVVEKFADRLFRNDYKAALKKDEESAHAASVHVNVKEAAIPEEEKPPTPMGQLQGKTIELYRASGYTKKSEVFHCCVGSLEYSWIGHR